MMKIYSSVIIFFLCFITHRCGGQPNITVSNLKKEIYKKSITIEYEELKINNLSIKYPKLTSKHFKRYLEKLMKNDQNENFCDDEGIVLIHYEVKHLSDYLISIVKNVEVQFCTHYSDLVSNESITLLVSSNELFQVKLSKNGLHKLNEKLKSTVECTYNTDDVQYAFFFHNGLANVYVYLDKICNYIEDIGVIEDNFKMVKI